MKRKAEDANEPKQNKEQRTSEKLSVVSVNGESGTTHDAKQLTSLLGETLNTKSSKWSGRVLLQQEPDQLYVYDLIAKKKLFDITGFESDPEAIQLKDGTIALCQNDTITLIEINGKVVQTTDCEHTLEDSIELQNGNILFISDTSARSVAGIYNRKENAVEELPCDDFEYIKVAQLKDGRTAFYSGENIDVYDESFEQLKSFEQESWMSHCTLYQDNVILCAGSKGLFTIDVEAEEEEEIYKWPKQKESEARVVVLENGIVVAQTSDKKLTFLKDKVVKKIVEVDAKSLAEISHGVVAYINLETTKVNTDDTNTDELNEYDLPEDSSIVALLR